MTDFHETHVPPAAQAPAPRPLPAAPLAAAFGIYGPICLAMGIFYTFCIIQIYYLFLHQGSLPESMTYAQYAHQGFYQLVFVIFINLALAFARPDAVITRYNLTHANISHSDLYYLQSLSTDAAPALLKYLPTEESCFEPWGGREQYLRSFLNHQPEQSFALSLRRYNFSSARANRLFGPVLTKIPD